MAYYTWIHECECEENFIIRPPHLIFRKVPKDLERDDVTSLKLPQGFGILALVWKRLPANRKKKGG
jgi:hypothetical protein